MHFFLKGKKRHSFLERKLFRCILQPASPIHWRCGEERDPGFRTRGQRGSVRPSARPLRPPAPLSLSLSVSLSLSRLTHLKDKEVACVISEVPFQFSLISSNMWHSMYKYFATKNWDLIAIANIYRVFHVCQAVECFTNTHLRTPYKTL